MFRYKITSLYSQATINYIKQIFANDGVFCSLSVGEIFTIIEEQVYFFETSKLHPLISLKNQIDYVVLQCILAEEKIIAPLLSCAFVDTANFNSFKQKYIDINNLNISYVFAIEKIKLLQKKQQYSSLNNLPVYAIEI